MTAPFAHTLGAISPEYAEAAGGEVSGWVDQTPIEPPHTCRPPSPYRYRLGARFHCDCDVVWVLRRNIGRGLQPSGPTWGRESRHERRQRLGLRWWQRARITPAEVER